MESLRGCSDLEQTRQARALGRHPARRSRNGGSLMMRAQSFLEAAGSTASSSTWESSKLSSDRAKVKDKGLSS